jgi:hypothetical protein
MSCSHATSAYAHREQVERLKQGGVDVVGEEHFTYFHSPARDRAPTIRNIRAEWSAAGLFPFNSKRVLRDIPKPPVKVSSNILSLKTEATSTDVVEVPDTPIMPITPVTTEALMSLHDLIVRDTHVLEKTSKDCLQRRIQKLASAAKVSFAERALFKDRNNFLLHLQINREAKTRRSTKPVVPGKAKVTNFEDFEEARAKRAVKEQALISKPKRGRKRKSKFALKESTVLPSPKPTVMQGIDAPKLTYTIRRYLHGERLLPRYTRPLSLALYDGVARRSVD